MENILTVKIITHDIIKSIDNLEYLEVTKLNLPEDESFLKYGRDVVIKNHDEFIKGDDYKKAIRCLNDNDIGEKLIKKHILTIYDYLNSEYKDNLKILKKTILKLEESYCEIAKEMVLTESEKRRKSGTTFEIDDAEETIYENLRCIIKMTEYTPISGGNITELNKIPDLFLNKRSLLTLKNNDNKCFLYCYIREFLNPITRNKLRITKRDKELANEIINKTNLTFENVAISEIDKIEKKLKVNINAFSRNKKYKIKTLLENLERIMIKY